MKINKIIYFVVVNILVMNLVLVASEKPVDEFTEIMKKFKFYTNKNNTNLIFVYGSL